MKNPLPFAFLSLWGFWALYQLIILIFPASGKHVDFLAVGSFLLVSTGAVLAWLLHRHPHRAVKLGFIALSVLLLWKFWVGAVLAYMHPIMGGHSFGGALGEWFKYATSSLRSVLTALLPPVLILVSIAFWPAYCHANKPPTSNL